MVSFICMYYERGSKLFSEDSHRLLRIEYKLSFVNGRELHCLFPSLKGPPARKSLRGSLLFGLAPAALLFRKLRFGRGSLLFGLAPVASNLFFVLELQTYSLVLLL